MLKMPTQARCDRVPPTDGVWGPVDLRVLQEDDLPLGNNWLLYYLRLLLFFYILRVDYELIRS